MDEYLMELNLFVKVQVSKMRSLEQVLAMVKRNGGRTFISLYSLANYLNRFN